MWEADTSWVLREGKNVCAELQQQMRPISGLYPGLIGSISVKKHMASDHFPIYSKYTSPYFFTICILKGPPETELALKFEQTFICFSFPCYFLNTGCLNLWNPQHPVAAISTI